MTTVCDRLWGFSRWLVVGVAVLVSSCVVAVPAGAQLELADSSGALPGPKAWWAGTCDLLSPAVEVGSAPAVARDCVDFGGFFPGTLNVNAPSPWQSLPSWRLSAVAEAGGHPDGSAAFFFTVDAANDGFGTGHDNPKGTVRNAVVDLPAGVVGSTLAVEKCSLEEFAPSPHECPAQSQVGVSSIRLTQSPGGGTPQTSTSVYPVYNLQARKGYTAEFGIPDIAVAGTNQGVSVRLFAKARTDGDFGVTTGAMQIPTQFPLVAQSLTFWGVPWATSHDRWRKSQAATQADGGSNIPLDGLAVGDRTSYDPSWGPIRPFFSNPTECDGTQPVTDVSMDSYETPGDLIPTGSAKPDGTPDLSSPGWIVAGSAAAPVSACGVPPFAPDIDLQPTASGADAPSGLSVDLALPQNNDPPAGVDDDPDDATGAPAHWKSAAGRATAHLDKAVVTLPPGMTVNPAAATGLVACSDDQIGLVQAGNPARFDNVDPFDGFGSPAAGTECPDGSKLGTVEVQTPLLSETLTGDVVLGTPKSTDPKSGQMFRLFLVLRNHDRGLVAKIAGTSVADGVVGEGGTGQLTATFDKNPRVPFDHMHLEFKPGQRAILANPPRCASTHDWSAVFSPWTASAGGQPVSDGGSFEVDENCGFAFAPTLKAGMSTQRRRGNGTFSFRFTRPQGHQSLRGLTAQLPTGLLASVRDVPLCTNVQATANACPAASKIGQVDAGAGSGTPFFLEKRGSVYLTEGYKGGPYGLSVSVPAEAGPFRGPLALKTIVVRQAIHVDRRTAQVTAISDPFPQVWHGVPLRVREVTVTIDRPNFMLNPSDCSPKQIKAILSSATNATSVRSVAFQAAGCGELAFKPKLALRLTGKRQMITRKHPGVRAQVNQAGIAEAGIKRAEVRLPKSLALDPDNAQALCEFADGTKPDLENHCPKGSIVGRARATSPLLNDPLVGNVYFVKNIRTNPQTGARIFTLPMIIVALRGEIAINLKGESSTTPGGRLVNTFADVPDAPVSQFNLNIAGGKNGILTVTRTRKNRINLCNKKQIAQADMDAQNGRRHDTSPRLKTPCKTKKKKRKTAAKRRN